MKRPLMLSALAFALFLFARFALVADPTPLQEKVKTQKQE
jgi:hypothetical protein